MRICLLLVMLLVLRTSGWVTNRARVLGRRLSSHGASGADAEYSYHVPVLRDECVEYLQVKPGGVYVDCTLGGGGHTRAILEAGGSVIGFDQDPEAVAKASSVCKEFIAAGKLEIFQCNFRGFANVVRTKSVLAAARSSNNELGGLVDGILMDLGVSSHQINEPSRGFAFGADGPLDMRMSKGQVAAFVASGTDGSSPSLSAATIVNEYDVESLANILYEFGEETRSRQIARDIVTARPLVTTGQLEKVISRTASWAQRPKMLARCFQALRIAVNDELGALDEALTSAHHCLLPLGRLAVISYHSLEDRRVKRLMRSGSVSGEENGDGAGVGSGSGSPWSPLFKRAQAPSDAEIERNRRARSAKLRVAELTPLPSKLELGVGDRDNITRLGKGKTNTAFVGAKQLLKRKLREEQSIREEEQSSYNN